MITGVLPTKVKRNMAPSIKNNDRDSGCEIIYDTDDYLFYRIFEKYQELAEKVDERINKIKSRKGKFTNSS